MLASPPYRMKMELTARRFLPSNGLSAVKTGVKEFFARWFFVPHGGSSFRVLRLF
jgi:hypothetical protein